MARDFTDILNAVWAANALTTIPNPPIPGQAYRNTEIDDSNLENGQQYSEVYDSARYNQLLYLLSGCLKMLMETGLPEWSEEQNYQQNAYTIGSDGKLYGPAKKASGPDNGGAVDPVTDAAGEAATWTLSLPDFEAPLAFDAAEGKVKLSVGNTTTVTDGKLETKIDPNGGLQSSAAGVGIKPVASGPVTVDANGINVSTFTAPTADGPGKAGLVPAPQAVDPSQQALRVLGLNAAFNTLTAGSFDLSWERTDSTNLVLGASNCAYGTNLEDLVVAGDYYASQWTNAPADGEGVYSLREMRTYGDANSTMRVAHAFFYAISAGKLFWRGGVAARPAGQRQEWRDWFEILGGNFAPMPTLSAGVGQVYFLPYGSGTLPEGGTWVVFTMGIDIGRGQTLGSVQFLAGGTLVGNAGTGWVMAQRIA